MRKHMYLITEHKDARLVGNVKFQDRKQTWPEKNKEGDIQKYDGEDFSVVGKEVCLGFHDFTEEEFNDSERVKEVIHKKLQEVDEEWRDKAGVEVEVNNG